MTDDLVELMRENIKKRRDDSFVLDSSKFEKVSVCPEHGWPLDEGFCQTCGFDARENTQEAVLVNDVRLAVGELKNFLESPRKLWECYPKLKELFYSEHKDLIRMGRIKDDEPSAWYRAWLINHVFKFAEEK